MIFLRFLPVFLLTTCALAQTWTQLPISVSAFYYSYGYASAFDPKSGTMVIHGGFEIDFGDTNFTVRIRNADGRGPVSQEFVSTSHPAPYASNHSAVYDPVGDSMILLTCGATYLLSNPFGTGSAVTDWRVLPTGGPPTICSQYTAVFDDMSRRVIVLGGTSSDVFVLRGLGTNSPFYERLNTAGTAPPSHSLHAAVYDSNTNRMIVFGGADNNCSPSNDLWVLSNANGLAGPSTWTRIQTAGGLPAPRLAMSAIYDSARDRMTVFGGSTSCSLYQNVNDVWVLVNTRTNPVWSNITPAGLSPSPRELYQLAYNPASQTMILFGGLLYLADLWIMHNPTGVDTTITSNPPGQSLTVDGVTSITPRSFTWGEQTPHTLSATSPPVTSTSRGSFLNWSDGGAQTHTVLGPSSPTTFTANYLIQYLLSLTNIGFGTLSAAPPSADGFYNNGANVQITATPAPGGTFLNFSGDLAGAVNPQTLTMSAPRSVTGNFSNCTYNLSATGATFATTPAYGSVNLFTPGNCPWNVTNVPDWVTITGGLFGNGNGVVSYVLAPGTSSTTRYATLRIANQPYTITRLGTGCSFTLSPTSLSTPAGGYSGSLSATATAPDCPRNATSNAPWITITSGANGTGSTTLDITVAANLSSASRAGAITIGDKTFPIIQPGTGPCTYSLPQSSLTLPATGGSGAAPVSTQPDCIWTATSNSPAFLTTNTAPNTGSGQASFTIQPNPNPSPRVGTLTVAGSTFLVQQPAANSNLLCTANATPNDIRVEGRSERIADILLNCTGPTQGLTGDVILRLNTGLASGPTDARLLLNDNPASFFTPQPTSADTLRWSGIPIVPSMRLTNVRVDPSLLTAATITASLTIESTVPIPVASGNLTVANPTNGIQFTRGAAIPTANPTQTQTSLAFTEHIPSAFSGARLRVRLTNIPPSAQLAVSAAALNNGLQTATLLLGADTNGLGGTPAAGSAFLPIPVSNGVAYATWQIDTSDPAVIETLTASLRVDSPNPNDADSIRITGSLAPITPTTFRDLSIPQSLSTLRTTIAQPTPLTFVSRITNTGDTPANNLSTVTTLSPGLSLIGCSASNGAPCPNPDGVVRVLTPSLPPGNSFTLTITAKVSPSLPAGAVLSSTTAASADTPGFDPDSATASLSFLTGQSCLPALDRGAATSASTGDMGLVNLLIGPSCPWTTSSSATWLTLQTTPSAGSATIHYTAAPNASPTPRSATLTIAGLTFPVTQAAAGCTFTATAATSIVNITASAPTCAWTAVAAPDWITLPAGANGTGSGPLSFSLAANPSNSPRTGTITIAGAVVQILQPAANPTAPFTDVPANSIYAPYITLLKQSGITNGCTPTTFCPDANTTRGQTAAFLIRAVFGSDTFPAASQTPYFTDVPANHPYFRYIQKLKELGITTGCTPTTYCPDDPINRGQLAVFLIRARLAIQAPTIPFAPTTPFFTDVPPNHPYFPFIQKMKELGITTGCSPTTYCPDAFTTRGQIATFLVRGFLTP